MDISEKLFINLIEWEGKHYVENEAGSFAKLMYSGTEVTLPTVDNVVMNSPALDWKLLKTGDLAVYSDGNVFVLGLVVGVIERQFCFANPKTSTVQVVDFAGSINGYKYINGFRVV